MTVLLKPSWRNRLRPTRMPRAVSVPAPVTAGNRVSVELPGGPLWFESDDEALTPAMEAFAGVLLLAAMSQGFTLELERPVSSDWLRGAKRNAARYQEWWGFDDDVLRATPTGHNPNPPIEPGGAGVCFTGGMDSFSELLRNQHLYSHIVFLHGADVRLDDVVRAASVRSMTEDVAAHLGINVVWVRTNVAGHALTRCVDWSYLHGAALAGCGHLLRGAIRSLTLAPSYGYNRLIPWGSRPDTDPDWSSSTMKIVHGYAGEWRIERIAPFASHPLVRRHLRVCTKYRTSTGNCSRCNKCLISMTQLCALGELHTSAAFDHSVPLAARLNAHKRAQERVVVVWEHTRDYGSLPRDVYDAVTRLIERSR